LTFLSLFVSTVVGKLLEQLGCRKLLCLSTPIVAQNAF
jgi:hypothetical protein